MGLKINFQDDDIALDFNEDVDDGMFTLTVGRVITAEDGTLISDKVATTRVNLIRMERIGHAFNSILKRINDIQEKRNETRGGPSQVPPPNQFHAPDAKRRH